MVGLSGESGVQGWVLFGDSDIEVVEIDLVLLRTSGLLVAE